MILGLDAKYSSASEWGLTERPHIMELLSLRGINSKIVVMVVMVVMVALFLLVFMEMDGV